MFGHSLTNSQCASYKINNDVVAVNLKAVHVLLVLGNGQEDNIIIH